MTGATVQDGQAELPSAQSTRSYWHRDPSEILKGHRTTTQLPSTADVVIVGSGITGAFAARALAEKWLGCKVVMLEAREACWGATGRNGGHCQPSTYSPSPSISRFELRNYAHIRDLVAAHDIDCDWTALRGVHAFFTPDLFAQAALAVADRHAGKAGPDLIDCATVVRDAEHLEALGLKVGTRDGAVGAVVQEQAASLWPYKLVCWVLEDLLKRSGGDEALGGAGRFSFNLQTGTPATHLQRLESRVGDADKDSDDQPAACRWVVHTPRGQIAARHVLLASNGYTSHLVPSLADLIVPVRGQVAALIPKPQPKPTTNPVLNVDHGPDAHSRPPSPDPQPLEFEHRHGPVKLRHSYVFMGTPPNAPSQDDYLIQRPPDPHELILGGGRARGAGRGVGASADDWVDPVVAAYLRRVLNASMDLGGGGGEMAATHEWTGIMGFSRDMCPWVGSVPLEGPGGVETGTGTRTGTAKRHGLWVSAGYTGHGMPQAALCARAVVGMMVREATSPQGAAVEHECQLEEEDEDVAALPDEFRITADRVRRAREMEGVKEMDAKDMFI